MYYSTLDSTIELGPPDALDVGFSMSSSLDVVAGGLPSERYHEHLDAVLDSGNYRTLSQRDRTYFLDD